MKRHNLTDEEKIKLYKATNDLKIILNDLGLVLEKTKNVKNNLGMTPEFALLRYVYLRENPNEKSDNKAGVVGS